MIQCNAEINFGMPSLRGRRLTVYDIITHAYYGDTVVDALEDYSISLSDLYDAINYCKNLNCKSDKDRLNYCDGCILRTIDEGWHFDKENYIENHANGQHFVVSKDGKTFFLGSLKDFEDSEFGKVTWLIAEDVEKRMK